MISSANAWSRRLFEEAGDFHAGRYSDGPVGARPRIKFSAVQPVPEYHSFPDGRDCADAELPAPAALMRALSGPSALKCGAVPLCRC